jgi:pantetheine-phosphate adenylyltransferase
MKKTAVYPGSFDPITKGHIDIIKRSAKLFDELKIGILINSSKNSWFTIEERIELVKRILEKENVKAEVLSFEGLTVDFMAEQNANILVRGLRAVSDYEYELQFTLTNTILATQPFETLFFTAPREYLYLSSSLVKEVALNKGKLDKFLPESIINDIEERAEKIRKG